MSSDKDSIIGHREQVPDPKTQIDLLRKYLRGERNATYSSAEVIVFAARTAADKAIDVIYTTGGLRGQRKYNDTEIDEIRAEFHRLEELLERKKRGENIESEVDVPAIEEIAEETKKPETDAAPPKTPKTPKKPAVIKSSSDIPEIVDIKELIDTAVEHYSKSNTIEAKRNFQKAIEEIEEAKARGIDVSGVELEIKSLGSFFE